MSFRPYFPLTVAAVAAIALFGTVADGSAQAKKKKKPAAFMPVEDVEGLPRVLLIGDSISIGYTVPVQELLKGKANVHRPLTNCGPTTNGVDHLDEWLETGGKGKKWDVIHFNWGLHDLKYLEPNGKGLGDPKDPANYQQVPPDEYRKNLADLVAKLKETGATLIWRNTTPVPEGAAGRIAGDAAKYNEIAAEVMKEAGVQTHDLFTFAKEKEKEIQREANVHYTEEGSRKLAEEVVKVIEAAL
ncbi:MAG: hypothetical protein CMO55_10445 [Verrucomicrobiales bacterium]|nr:hypothetical protein [Verrucomicrobiales bacterium]